MIRLIERRVCVCCGRSHRLLPDDQIPYKHYATDVIEKVVDDDFTEEELLEYEDYPADKTKAYWHEWAIWFLKNSEGHIRSAVHRIKDASYGFLASRVSLLEEIKSRIGHGWLSVITWLVVNTGGATVMPEPG